MKNQIMSILIFLVRGVHMYLTTTLKISGANFYEYNIHYSMASGTYNLIL